MRRRLWLLALAAASLPVSPLPADALHVDGTGGICAEFDPDSGRYTVAAVEQGWRFSGTPGRTVTGSATDEGVDALGSYREIRFSWDASGPVRGSIRVYDSRPAVLFSLTCDAPEERLPVPFPRFSSFPVGLHPFSYKEKVFAPPSFALENNGTPWLLFDDAGDAVIISPAANFMIAAMGGDGEREISCGLDAEAKGLPAGFTHRALMVFGKGINATWDAWGAALRDEVGRPPVPNDADLGLRTLGYWTDNGASYYYNYDPALGYAGTLEKLVDRYREERIPIRYLQLDSWWYEKTLTSPDGKEGKTKNPKLPEGAWNRYGGLLTYEADPAVLPDGLEGFEKEIGGLPLITHNRWIDPQSPYRRQYKVSGYAAVDPAFWDHIMGTLSSGGVDCYEQDWLNVIYEHSPELRSSPGAAEAFLGGMALAAKDRGMSVQYCMTLPRYYLAGARYANVTTARASGDRFERKKWGAFLYTSRLCGAAGIWPWTDVFMSKESANLLIATLSGGMVGVGDALGDESRANLLRAARADGVLIKPDAPLYPTDEMYYSDEYDRKLPMVAWTRTDHAAQRTAYVFAYNRGAGPAEIRFTPSEFGFKGEVMVMNMSSLTAFREPAGEPFIGRIGEAASAYFVVVPVGPQGLAFFGDGTKFATNGRKRIAALEAIPGGLSATVLFGAGEDSVRLFGYAPQAPVAEASQGAAGPVDYDPATGRFVVAVMPSAEVEAEQPGGDPIRKAVVAIRVPVPAEP